MLIRDIAGVIMMAGRGKKDGGAYHEILVGDEI